MKKPILHLAAVTILMIAATGCSKEIITSSVRSPYSLKNTDSDNFYILPKKILKVTANYVIKEQIDENNKFVKTLSCEVKDDIKVEPVLVPDYNEQFVLRNKKQNKISVKIESGTEANGILSGINSEVTPEGVEILKGTAEVIGTLVKTALQINGLRKSTDFIEELPIKKTKTETNTRDRIVQIIQFINPETLPYQVNLPAPAFLDEFKFKNTITLKLSTEYHQPSNLNAVREQIKTSSYEGIIYRLPVPVKVEVIEVKVSDKGVPNNQQAINDIIYFPQFGQYEIASTNIDYTIFSGKRSILISFNANTGGLQKIEIVKESALKEAFAEGKNTVSTIGTAYEDIKNKNKITAADLEEQIKLLELQKKLQELQQED
jgi:hypothetical protein